MTDFVTRQMEKGLRALQTVEAFDYDAAYGAAYSGIHCLDARGEIEGELIYGRTLALRVWAERQKIRVVA